MPITALEAKPPGSALGAGLFHSTTPELAWTG